MKETDFVRILEPNAVDKGLKRNQARLYKSGRYAEYELKASRTINIMPYFNEFKKRRTDLYIWWLAL